MNKSKRVKIFKVVACIFLAIALLVLGGCSGDETKKVQQGMTAYLQERYGIEFEVEKPYITGGGDASHYQAKAHPKEQREPIFLVNGDSYPVRLNGKYDDDYLKKKWDYQGKLEIEKKIREIYGESADYAVSYSFGGGSYVLKDLDYSQVFEASKNSKINSTSAILYDVFIDGAQFNKEKEAEKVYKLLKPYIFDFSNNYNVYITYIDKSDKEDYLKNTKLYSDKAYRNIYSANKDKKILGYFCLRSTKEKPYIINSGSDIIKFSEY